MLAARYDKATGACQSLEAHARQVAARCATACEPLGLQKLGYLAGLLHDAGKAGQPFQDYLFERNGPAARGSVNHSSCGARYVWEHLSDRSASGRLAADLMAAAMSGHHSGLPDCLTPGGADGLHQRLYPERDAGVEAALAAFFTCGVTEAETEALFPQVEAEVAALHTRLQDIAAVAPEGQRRRMTAALLGMAARFLVSCLLDADRCDARVWAAGPLPEAQADWGTWAARLEQRLAGFDPRPPVNRIRMEIADACRAAIGRGPGVYQLYVPTGGGKTLSSLRFALGTAAAGGARRVLYVAPYKTILEQNAGDIRAILGDGPAILEHHSDYLPPEGAEALERYEWATERWDAPLILTTAVQFLNTLFLGKNAAARRMASLARSVILLDEVQAMPVKLTYLVNVALNFLAGACGCTVVLCTATQPALEEVAAPLRLAPACQLTPDVEGLFTQLRRTRLVDLTVQPPFRREELAGFLLEQLAQKGSVLAVLNTKSAVRRLYQTVLERQGEQPAQVYHLTTSLCAAHRRYLLDAIRTALAEGRPVLCISTQLMEAGVDLSFGCAVRALAGLDSASQTAGRCNRHGEADCRQVYLVRVEDERLERLPDIEKGQLATLDVLDEYPDDLLSPAALRQYYRRYFYEQARRDALGYKVRKYARPDIYQPTSLYELLSDNPLGSARLARPGLRQAFATAGSLMRVIDQPGVDVVTPYGEGKALGEALLADPDLAQLPGLLRSIQRYTVHLYDHERKRLEELGALIPTPCGVLLLQEGYYDDHLGVVLERMEMPFYLM